MLEDTATRVRRPRRKASVQPRITNEIQVEVRTFKGLQQLAYPLALDSYQRPYVWDKAKLEQLIDDLLEFQEQDPSLPDYYMGTLLLHRNRERESLFVIDGQQRLTSLCILYHVLRRRPPPRRMAFEYSSLVSVRNIKHACTILQEKAAGRLRAELLNRLNFTVIEVGNEDLAFTFFDTQNNRGVPLKPTDLLKAFHLRAIKTGKPQRDEALQESCARRWEAVQVSGEKGKRSRDHDFAPELFHSYLWRARNWRGQKVIERETHDELLMTFQHQSIPTAVATEVPLYPGVNNRLAAALTLRPDDEHYWTLQSVDINESAASLPFSLRQPIHQGIGFFLYAEKYATLLNWLLHDETEDAEVVAFRGFYNRVVATLSPYLRELYKLAALMYVDQFSSVQLMRFGLWLDHVLGAIRLQKAYIFDRAPLRYLMDKEHNLLDVIAGAYRPEEVIDFLRSDDMATRGYESARARKVVRGKGIRGRYLDALMNYYGKDSLQDKPLWVEAALEAR
ncbi:DUF262 domain-containing protein [Halomonas sp. Bachu 37]|uniref:DUF262 domain-containing protein n=1 Tax=Halomonas kashgarensis TaxID=3084920 RepID=UPI0032179A44